MFQPRLPLGLLIKLMISHLTFSKKDRENDPDSMSHDHIGIKVMRGLLTSSQLVLCVKHCKHIIDIVPTIVTFSFRNTLFKALNAYIVKSSQTVITIRTTKLTHAQGKHSMVGHKEFPDAISNCYEDQGIIFFTFAIIDCVLRPTIKCSRQPWHHNYTLFLENNQLPTGIY